ncbi:DNA (cytosine-5-)-methyltransferase [Gordonia sp. HY442]|uniref:DNA (cytosine-5-)-methyltransferase n=1 Tax=Gordonia zhenghanii TaxID=2911516 RepID=UPI001F0243D8|nr:DNA (cytosine-5-)-methyltransferase [Gordonia zhenghanii]MCF8606886.1 DNA (cytosine-5-)-methyltransferase [Gordonia zhenghanii]
MTTGADQGIGGYSVVEICAGAGGQALGLEQAGFEHRLAVELDQNAAATLSLNRPNWDVRVGDVANAEVWDPSEFEGVDLLAGGVPCPPFSIAGRQLGASDERDLFAWAVEQVAIVKPRALMLENVRGLSQPRFAAYRQRVLDRLAELGYEAFWKLIYAADFGVPQLRPRFVLVALKTEDARFFAWPESVESSSTVGSALNDLMGADGWPHINSWVTMADAVGPTIVGGSKKHGGADLGPTRAKEAWLKLGVDGKGVADAPPSAFSPHPSVKPPRLTIEMVKRIQGWGASDSWQFSGRKTSQYRQIGNAFPPPVAAAVGRSIRNAFNHEVIAAGVESAATAVSADPLFSLLSSSCGGVRESDIYAAIPDLTERILGKRLQRLSLDFAIHESVIDGETSYRLGEFRGFTGQSEHFRHDYITANRSKVS